MAGIGNALMQKEAIVTHVKVRSETNLAQVEIILSFPGGSTAPLVRHIRSSNLHAVDVSEIAWSKGWPWCLVSCLVSVVASLPSVSTLWEINQHSRFH